MTTRRIIDRLLYPAQWVIHTALGLGFIMLVTLIIMSLSGCAAEGPKETVNIEGCEYIIVHTSWGAMFSHKGNCINPIHQCP